MREGERTAGTRTAPDPRSEWAFLGRRVLHVSRHVPAEDGIANYADQLEAALREGRTFTRLGVPLGGGDRVVELWGGFKPLRLLSAARDHDDVLIQYIPWYFVRGGVTSRIASYAALAAVARRSRVTWVVHEEDERLPEEVGRRGRMCFAAEEAVRRLFWGWARRLVFHSEVERERFSKRYPPREARDERVVTHGAFFVSQVTAPRDEARARLDLSGEAVILVCIGTLSPHKGVDRVVAAVDELAESKLELHIVGRPIRSSTEVDRYADELRELVARTAGVELHERYVSDEEFDLWIRAADAVVVAYRTAASSGVVERAHLLGTTLITSGAGGIAEQERPGDLHFNTDAELVEAIRAVVDDAR